MDSTQGTSFSLHPKVGRPYGGWLKAERVAQGVSQREAAGRAGVTQQAFDQYEKGEERASITLERLQRAADALDCELIYYLVRKPRRSPASTGARPRRTEPEPEGELPVSLL